MSSPTVTVSPALMEALKAEHERTRAALSPMLDTFAAFSRAVARTPLYKARAAKAALVALLSELPKWARDSFAWLVVILGGWLPEHSPPPIHLELVTSQGPHAPPVRSDYRIGTRPHSQKEPEGLRAVPLRDITRDT